ncbi:MAG: hypothetical protein Q7W02_11540 [Candidatus Rokubacteria bacterium]|nr:hypothetical protein [Candidatus Rokubacteria bacterium]
MNGRVLLAGWPFAGLLALDAGHAEVSGTAPVRGLIVETDSQGGIFVLDSEDVTCPLTTDAATRCYGVDGYPIARGDIHVGDIVEAIQEKHGEEWVMTKVRVLRLASSPSLGAC